MTSMMLALALPTVVLTSAEPAWLTSVLLAANAVLIAVLSAPLVRRLRGIRPRVLRRPLRVGRALPFLVHGLVNALSVPALLWLERRLPVAAVGALS